MKLIADIEGERLTVEVRREGARVVAEVGGRGYELEAREAEPGVYLLTHDGRVYECRLREAEGATEVRVGRSVYELTLSDPKRLRGARAAAGLDSGRSQIVAPMPGKIVRVLVEQGQAVEAGDGVIVVEAMKMQNELKSPRAGAIVELRASTGATVNAGDVLAVIE